MTIAPKKPRVDGGSESRRERNAQASASRAPEVSRSYDDGVGSSGRRLRVSGKTGSGGGTLGVSSGGAKAAKPSKLDESAVGEQRNSDDELETAAGATPEEEELFLRQLSEAGLAIKPMGEDGACLFRAVADHVYGDQDFHPTVRQLCLDYMEKNREYFSQFVTEDWREYVRRKRAPDCHGNHVEIQAMAELFSRPIEVYQPGRGGQSGSGRIEPINTFQAARTPEGNPPIRVSYHGQVHYNSVVEPWGPATVGVGLGLPGLNPANHHAQALREAVTMSEREGIEQAMLEDKLRATDQEATSADLENQVLRESMMQFIRESEDRLRKENAPCHSGSLPSKRSPKPTSSAKAGQSSKPASPKSTSSAGGPGEGGLMSGSPVGALDTASILSAVPSAGFADGDFVTDEDDVLTRVLALSQQEYLDSLQSQKKKAEPEGSAKPDKDSADKAPSSPTADAKPKSPSSSDA